MGSGKTQRRHPGEGFPKAPAGPLAKGKYMLRVVSPIANLTDNEQQEITAPKVLNRSHETQLPLAPIARVPKDRP